MSEYWRTKDMPLVVYLVLNGHNSVKLEYEETSDSRFHSSVFWYFDDTDDLRDCVDEYTQGDARVEPAAYNSVFARVRGEMFDFLKRIGVRTRTA